MIYLKLKIEILRDRFIMCLTYLTLLLVFWQIVLMCSLNLSCELDLNVFNVPNSSILIGLLHVFL